MLACRVPNGKQMSTSWAVRRTDWRPVNGEDDPEEQNRPSALSDSTHSSDMNFDDSSSYADSASFGHTSTPESSTAEPSIRTSDEYPDWASSGSSSNPFDRSHSGEDDVGMSD